MVTQTEYQTFLDDISACFLTADFDTWRSRVLLPFSLVTPKGPVVLYTRDALKENFDLYLKAVAIMHVDQVVRRPIGLEDCADGTWIGTYETNLLSAGQRTTAPYTSSALLVRDDGRLKMTSILNARGHHDWTGVNPASG